MMTMSGFVDPVINSPQTRCRSAKQVGRRANVAEERVAVRRVAGKLFQMTKPVTTKLLSPSMVVVLGTGGNPCERADRRCLTGDSADCQTVVSQVSHSYCDATRKYVYLIRQKMNNVSIRQAISALEAHHSHACSARPATIQQTDIFEY